MPRLLDPTMLRYTLQVLDGQTIMDLLHYALLEQKILLISSNSILLTAVAESIRALMFPFVWTHVYIPVVPDYLDVHGLIDAPVPFIAGIVTEQAEALDQFPSHSHVR